MAENKTYYYLKINKDFFEDDTIQWIEEQKNGKDYVIFYLKLCLRSLENEGGLIRYVGEKLIPYDVQALAKLTNTNTDTVAVAMKLFLEIGLVDRLDNGEIFMNQIKEMIGSETDSAKRMRKHRAKQKELPSQCDNNVQTSDAMLEIEIEIEKELEVEPILTKNIKETIIEEWNNLGLQQLRSINSNTVRDKSLKARMKEYSLDEIIQAIKLIEKSNFLQGVNDRNWIITFDWLLNPNNFIKVLEGNYTDKALKKDIIEDDNPFRNK